MAELEEGKIEEGVVVDDVGDWSLGTQGVGSLQRKGLACKDVI